LIYHLLKKLIKRKKKKIAEEIVAPVSNIVIKTKKYINSPEPVNDINVEVEIKDKEPKDTSNNNKPEEVAEKWEISFFKKKKGKDEFKINKDEKPLYLENALNVDLGNNNYLNSIWTVWVHKTDCIVWTEQSYKNIYTIDSVGSFWRFFNNFHLLDKNAYQFFIMRNQTKPIWEDNDNKKKEVYVLLN